MIENDGSYIRMRLTGPSETIRAVREHFPGTEAQNDALIVETADLHMRACLALRILRRGVLCVPQLDPDRLDGALQFSLAAWRGHLLEACRTAWGHADTYAARTSCGRFWGVRCKGFAGYMGTAKTESGALVEALHAAADRVRALGPSY